MPLGMEVGLSPGDIMLDWDPAPPPQKRAQSSQFSAHVYCGQTVGWIKMALGMYVGLGPGHIVLDGDPAPHPTKGGITPNFGQTNLYCGIFIANLWNRAGHYIFALWFLSSSIFFLSSRNLSARTMDVYHTSTHDVVLCEFSMQV